MDLMREMKCQERFHVRVVAFVIKALTSCMSHFSLVVSLPRAG